MQSTVNQEFIEKYKIDTRGLALTDFEELDFMRIGICQRGWVAVDHNENRFGYFESKEETFKFMASYYLYELLQAQKRLEKTMNFTLSNNWK